MKSLSLSKKIILIIMFLLVLFNSLNEFKYAFKAKTYDDFAVYVDKITPDLMNKYSVNGVAIALVENENIKWVKGYGWADKKNQIPVTENTIFQVASNSKTVAAWGVMKLVENNIVDLDMSVTEILTRWQLPESEYSNEDVTIRTLLSHTGGLRKINYAGYSPEEYMPSLEDSLSGKVKGLKELTINTKPGKDYHYTGGGYTLLQLIVEELTGKSFSEYMEETVLTKLEMNSSSYIWKLDFKDRIAKGYGALGQEMPNYLYVEEAAAGLYTNILDFAKFVNANITIFNQNNVLTEESIAMMYTPNEKDYGLGYIIKELPDSTQLIYHGGTNRGWRSQFAILPEMGKGLVVLTNSENGKKLHSDIVGIWTKWHTKYIPAFYKKVILMRILIKTLALLIVLGLFILLYNMIQEGLKKKTQLNNGTSKIKKVFVKCSALTLLAIGWIIVFYTGIVYNGWTFVSFMPAGFKLLTVAILAAVILLNIKMLLERYSKS